LLTDNLYVKELENKLSDREKEIFNIACEALLVAPREIHELVNILESNDNYE
jgi:hypothetical protein